MVGLSRTRCLTVVAVLGASSAARSQPAPAPAEQPAKKKSLYEPKIDGFLQLMWRTSFDTDDDGDAQPSVFQVQRARVEIEGKLAKKMGYVIGIDARPEDVSESLRDAFVWTRHIPFHELRFGQQKVQFGYENPKSSSKLYYVKRSKVSEELSRGPGFTVALPQSSRDIGIGVVGEIPIACGFSIEDGVSVVNGTGPNVQTDSTVHKNYWGRLGGRYQNAALDLDLRVGISGGYGDGYDPGVLGVPYYFRMKRLGVDVEADYTYAFVAAEYVFGRDTEIAGGSPDIDHDADGYYVVVAGKTPWRAGPMVRYDRYDDDFQAYHYRRWTLGAYYGKRSDKLRAMVNFEHRPERDDRLTVWLQAKF